MENENDSLGRVGVVADMLDMSERSVWRLVARGHLPPPVRVGRSARFSLSEVEEFIRKLKEDRPADGGVK